MGAVGRAKRANTLSDNVFVVTRHRGVDYLRQAVRQRLEEEGLRPFSLRTGIPVGQLRSVAHGRAARSTTIEAIATVLGLEFYIGPPRADSSTQSQPLPSEITRALDLPEDACVADAVAVIDKDAMASKLRDGISMLQELLDRVTTGLSSDRSPEPLNPRRMSRR